MSINWTYYNVCFHTLTIRFRKFPLYPEFGKDSNGIYVKDCGEVQG